MDMAALRIGGVVGATLGLMGSFLLSAPAEEPKDGRSAASDAGMVVSVSRPASEVGAAVLRQGGNAVDAAVATAFALAVTWPEAGNIGGGGFMLVYPGGKAEPTFFDYRETAPAAAAKEMFAKGDREPHRRSGVPGTVRGLYLAHQKLGKRPWKDLVTPAIHLAEDGFEVNAALARSLNGVLRRSADFKELQRVYGKDGGKGRWQAGDRLVHKDLAATLRLIADNGPDGFYKGPTAERIVAEMKAGGGLITLDDLASYRARERRPVYGVYRGYDVYGPPPPSSGGVALIEMLNILENYDLKKQGRWSAETLHLMIEAMRRAYCDRARHLGDPDFVAVPEHLTTKEYARKLAASIDPKKATRSDALADGVALAGEGEQTTHFSIIDRDGMAVANTYTLESSFGSRVVAPGAGFLLNDEMNDFNPVPGVTDRKGRIGTEPNLIAPGKRMLSSMTPTIVARDGKVLLVTGSPGGRTIINTVLCVALNVLEFEMPLREAIDAPRLHHAWMPDQVAVEAGLRKDHAEALKKLEALGHAIDSASTAQGDAHSIYVDPKTGRRQGEADRRRDGWAASS
jgi:gamma-glutamyltranspeptidase/glutathione hydrolase